VLGVDVQPHAAPPGRVDQRVLDRADDLAIARREVLDPARLDREAVAVAEQRAGVGANVGHELVVQRLEPGRPRPVDVPQDPGRRAQVRHRAPREITIEGIDQLAEALLARRRGPDPDRALRDARDLGRHHDVGLGRADDAKLVDDHAGRFPFSVASIPASAKKRLWR
jgi:hypothetical protein